MATTENNVDIKALYDAVLASDNAVLREGFGSLIEEIMNLRRELMEQRGFVSALLNEKVINQKKQIQKELDEQKGQKIRRGV